MLRRTIILLLCCFFLLLPSFNNHLALAVAGANALNPSLSSDGHFLAFEASSASLVSGDTNGWTDIFVRDRQTGEITRVSVSSSGTQANGGSSSPDISDDGRYVVFLSSANNLAPGNPDNFNHIFVRDRQTATTTRADISTAGTQANGTANRPTISNDGRYIIFTSEASNLVTGDTNNSSDIFMRDTQTGVTTRLSVTSTGTEGDWKSEWGSLSADNHFLVFSSGASNLVTGDTNQSSDVFVRDMQTGNVTRVSVTSAGVQGNDSAGFPSISADGRYVVFYAYANNLVAGDTNGTGDTFVRDRQTNTTTRVSVSSNGTQGVGFLGSGGGAITGDGRYVVFPADFSNLVPNDTNGKQDIFLHDRQTGVTTRISVSASSAQANGNSFNVLVTSDGHWIAFASVASNLVPGDDFWTDVFILDRQTGDLTRESVPPMPVPAVTSPANGAAVNSDKPLFKWNSVSGVARYEIRIDTMNPPVRQFNAGTATQFTPTIPLLALPYFWQVRAIGTDGRISAWSALRNFTVALPTSAAPIRNFISTTMVTLTWNSIPGTATYEIQVDDTSAFSGTLAFEQTVSAPALTTNTSALSNGTYYWRVRACNGTCGAWSSPSLFAVIH